MSGIGKFVETDCRLMAARGWGLGGTGSDCLMGMRFPFEMMKKFWIKILVMVVQHCECNEYQ